MAPTKNADGPQKQRGWPRSQADSLRKRFLWAHVSDDEYEAIQKHCQQEGISVSQFMADLLLEDAANSKTRRKQKVTLRPEIVLTPQQYTKLELLARLHQKKSVGEFILDVLEPQLELKRLHTPVKKKIIRYYLSDAEHETVTDHIAASGLSATNYAAMLALRAVRKERKRRTKS